MAQPQAYNQAFVQPNKGTLIPGQTIAVNKYTVQVERYLSQGSFIVSSPMSAISRSVRWICACIPRQDCDAGVRHHTSCSQTYRGSDRDYADRGEERGGHYGELIRACLFFQSVGADVYNYSVY